MWGRFANRPFEKRVARNKNQTQGDHMDKENIEILFTKISGLEEESVDLMKKLIAINSVGPASDGPGEQEKADFLKNYLGQVGFKQVSSYPAPDDRVANGERPNLVAVLPGKNSEKTLWILSHTDIVPAGDLSKWETDPFDPVVKDGKIFGRGSEDNHQGTVSSVLMARAFIETGTQPAINIGLVFMADEETGSEYGLTYLIENHSDLFKKDDLIIIPDAGEPDGSMIEVAEKSILWVKFKTIGKQVHASVPAQGVNAFRAASNLVVKLEDLHNIYNIEDKVFAPSRSTFEPTKKEANVPNVNTIPGDDVFFLDCRILPDYNIEEVLGTIRGMADDIEKSFNVKIEISTEQKKQAAPATEVTAPIVKLLKTAVKQVYGVDAKPQGIGGGTVAAVFRRHDYSVAVWATVDDLAHQPNEYCSISNMINDAKVFTLCAQNNS
jgi:succinyl-diaminopimelate desuccinylase